MYRRLDHSNYSEKFLRIEIFVYNVEEILYYYRICLLMYQNSDDKVVYYHQMYLFYVYVVKYKDFLSVLDHVHRNDDHNKDFHNNYHLYVMDQNEFEYKIIHQYFEDLIPEKKK
jgi:hypothetical protein